jgi:DNA-binding NtrC family response regulator
MYKILFIDRDNIQHDLLKIVIPEGYRCEYMSSADFTGITGLDADIFIIDISSMPEEKLTGMFPLYDAASLPPIIGLTDHSDLALSLKLMKHGWFDFIIKPISSEQLTQTLLNAAAVSELKNIQVSDICDGSPLNHIIGKSKSVNHVKKDIIKFSGQKCPILILGESGTGKELVAKTIHLLSERADHPFIPRNCSAIPETLFDVEMQGSEKGAFTDAPSRPGCFEMAHKGTLFLDEIGEMPVSCQSKLLRLLEDPIITRFGGVHQIQVDTRIISASNRNLKQCMEVKEFREDLFYRINVLTLQLPPLRDRIEDITDLSLHFLKAYPSVSISEASVNKLKDHSWPGNIRELKNVIDRAAVLCSDNLIRPADIRFF